MFVENMNYLKKSELVERKLLMGGFETTMIVAVGWSKL